MARPGVVRNSLMAHPNALSGFTRQLTVFALSLISAASVLVPSVEAQGKKQTAVQVEVGDSIGLPLPDAKIEVFTFMDGGVFWEWVPIDSAALPIGINLLRFSHPGYRSATFSVPIREQTTLSLRVRLDPQRDTSSASETVEARPVRAIGLVIDGRAHTDIVGRRRVLEHEAFEKESVTRFGPLMRRARNTDLKVLPASGGSFRVLGQSTGGSYNCPVQVMVNGDRRRILPFETFDQLFAVADAETIEIFPSGNSVPLSYQLSTSGCGLMVVWFRSL
jgi:hypothetical protein